MGLSYTSYYGLYRISDMGPEVKGWAATDYNPQVIALLIKAATNHVHGAATPIRYPGYNYANSATPILLNATENNNAGGVISPGTVIGVRLAYVNALGLETEASPEIQKVMSSAPARPFAPDVGSPLATPTGSALQGGTYVYAMTKKKGAGETQLSSISQVDVPFNSSGAASYAVQLSFANIISYADGTDALRLYRANGLNSDFQLVETITDTIMTSYLDDGSLEDPNTSPPITNTFDKNKVLTIDWSNISHPSAAQRLRIYVTQTPGVYGTNHLLSEITLATPSGVLNYIGSETLGTAWPKEFSQMPDSPPKLKLNSEATGAPVLTEMMDFQGWEALDFVLPWNLAHSTPIRGAVYYDYAADQIRARLAGGFVTLAQAGASFVHGNTESGGHNASNILSGSFTQAQVNNIFTNTAGAQIRKPVVNVQYATPFATPFVKNTTAFEAIPDMQILCVPAYAGEWWEFTFGGSFTLSSGVNDSIVLSTRLEINGSLTAADHATRSVTHVKNSFGLPTNQTLQMTFATPMSTSATIRAMWGHTGGTVTALASRRSLLGKSVF